MRFDFGSDAIGRHRHRPAEQLLQARGDGLEAHLRIRLALGTAEVGREDHAGAVVERVLNGRQRRLDALVAGDFHFAPVVLLQRDIEIDANEHAFAVEIEITNR